MNIVWSDGSVHIPAWFGCTAAEKDLIPVRSVTADTPINEALRTGRIVECGSFDDFLFAGPEYAQKLFPNGFAYSLAWPIPDFGVLTTFCGKKTNLSPTTELFLNAVGGILSLHLSQGAYRANFRSHDIQKDSVALLALTPRQWIILEGLRRGSTNASIAQELDVSESLVRQETVRIYRRLDVSGRKELYIKEAIVGQLN